MSSSRANYRTSCVIRRSRTGKVLRLTVALSTPGGCSYEAGRMTYFRSSLLAFSLLTACGGDDSGSGAIALANLGDAMATSYCAKTFECCTMAETEQRFEGAPVTDEASCRMFYAGFFNALAADFQASIDAGKLVYDGDAARQCVNALNAMACTDYARDDDPLSRECPDPFMGQVANDMQCKFDDECQSGYCEGDSQFPAPGTPGTCKAAPTSGQACMDFTCADGLTCENGVCTALKADGAACYDGAECQSGGCNGASQSTAGTCGAPTTCNGQ